MDRQLDRPLSDLAASGKGGYGAAQNEPAHLRDYFLVVFKRKWLILSLVVVVTTLVAVQMYRMPSVYEAETTLQIEPKKDSIFAKGTDKIVINTGRGGTDPVYVQTQLRLLENRALARQVIRTLDLQNNPGFLGDSSQAGFISSIRRIFLRDKKRTAPPLAPAETGLGEVRPEVSMDEMIDQKLSQEELQRLEPYEDALAANLRVESEIGTNLVKLHYRHTNPELAQKIVNTLADIFVYNNFDREVTGANRNSKLLAEKIVELQMKISSLEAQRYNFAKQNNLPFDTTPGANLEAARLATLQQQLLEAENKRKDLESLYNEADKAADAAAIPQVQDNQRIQKLRTQLDDLEQKRAELLETYTVEHPEVKRVDKKIGALNESLTKAPKTIVASMRTSLQSAKEKESKLRVDYDQQKGTTTAQSLAMIEYSRILQDLETNKQDLNLMRQRLREIENTNPDRVNNVSVTTYSRVPREPVGPPRARNILLALLLSLGAGIGLAFLLDYLDDTLKTVDDVDRYLHLPSLALIPTSGDARRRLKGVSGAPAEGESTALALTTDVRSPVAEAYRHLRTSLLLSSAGQPPRTILVTSSQPSEGKTTTAVNTAIMLAQTGADVLIIDCDLRRPRIHANFGVTNARGLTNYLSGERDLDALIQKFDKQPNLKLLTSGPIPPNPAELLGSSEMRRLLSQLAERFTHVVIDSPPAISFTDASILSTMVDGVMLVVHGGRSSRAIVRRAKQQLIDVGANIFGIVLNNVKLDSTEYYYSGYYSNYYAYEDEDETPGGAAEGASPSGRAG
jgi:capsular exopolysaccharide synthesis family protein